MKKLLAIVLLSMPVLAHAGGDDDFGAWVELGVQKNLPHNWSVGVEAELRTEDNVSQVDRWAIGTSLNYKVNKYLKLGVSYTFMDKYSPEKMKVKEYDEDDDWDSGYNLYSKYWTPRHRVCFEANGSVKLWKWLRVSVRERYQYTRTSGKHVDRLKHREALGEQHLVGFENGQPVYEYDSPEISDKYDQKYNDAEDSHILRSRLKLSLDKKRLAWSPFISVEAHNSLTNSMKLEKVRTMVGTEYKINKSHSVQAAYVFTCETDNGNQRHHALSVGYGYEF